MPRRSAPPPRAVGRLRRRPPCVPPLGLAAPLLPEQAECHRPAQPLHHRRTVRHARTASRSRRGGVRPARGVSTARLRRRVAPQPPFRDVRAVRSVVAAVARLLGAYCLLAAATALYAQTDSRHPNPAELAARARHPWPGWGPIPVPLLIGPLPRGLRSPTPEPAARSFAIDAGSAADGARRGSPSARRRVALTTG